MGVAFENMYKYCEDKKGLEDAMTYKESATIPSADLKGIRRYLESQSRGNDEIREHSQKLLDIAKSGKHSILFSILVS